MLNLPKIANQNNKVITLNTLRPTAINNVFSFLDLRVRYNVSEIKNKKLTKLLEEYLKEMIKTNPLKLSFVLNQKTTLKGVEENSSSPILQLLLKNLEIIVEEDFEDEEIIKSITKSIVSFEEIYSVSLSLYSYTFLEKFSDFFESLIKLPKLTRLILLFNNNTKQSYPFSKLTDSIYKLEGLTKLNLTFEKLDEEEAVGLSSALQRLTNLKEFSLSIFSLQNNCMKTILPLFGNELKNSIINLNLKVTELKKEMIYSLIELSNNLFNLVTLKLDISLQKGIYYFILETFVEVDIISITKSLEKLVSLELKFSNYSIGENGAFLLSSFLPKLVNLKILILDLSNNNICYKGANHLAKCFLQTKKLTKLDLDLYNNNITFPPKMSLLDHLENNNSQEININNDIEMCEEELYKNKTKCGELKDLKINLKKNNLGPDLIKYLSGKIPDLLSLRSLWLDLKWNQIDTKGAEAIASAIGNLNTLSKLYLNLECCKIKNQGASAVISQILQLSNLDNLILNFECNRINSEIKEVFSSRLEDFLKKIKIMNINLYNNFLSEENMKSLNIELSNF